MIVDTDIIIWYMRGNQQAYHFITSHEKFYISVVTYMELVQGMRNKNELVALRKALRKWKAETIYIDHEISNKAMFYVEKHYLSHSVALADALIAATAVSAGMPLATGNDKHFQIIKDLEIERFSPE